MALNEAELDHRLSRWVGAVANEVSLVPADRPGCVRPGRRDHPAATRRADRRRHHLGSTYGVIAFVTGRGLHGVLTLLPMARGATLATAWTRRGSPSRNRGGLIGSAGHGIRLSVVVAATVSVLVLAAAVVRPARRTRSWATTVHRWPAVSRS